MGPAENAGPENGGARPGGADGIGQHAATVNNASLNNSRPGFFARLTARATAIDSLLCVGLDPRASTVDAVRADCYKIIEATSDYALAFKPNSAFFEAHGPEGMLALLDVIASVPDDIPILLDAKRGDIADTSAAYARAAFDTLGAQAITVNPYLGGDALAPFISRPGFAAFIVCKTSNPGSDEFQKLEVRGTQAGEPLYETVARRALAWNKLGNIGLVVGATDPTALARIRSLAPDMWFLLPGIGAQGGDLAAALAAGLRADGLGLLITVSRTIAAARDPGQAARRIRDEIRELRSAGWTRSLPAPDAALADALLASGCVRFGQFTLKSGAVSPIYLDLRRLVSYPAALATVARAYARLLGEITFDRLAGIPYAALPIATAICLEMGRPMIYPRREVKDYGTRAAVEGEYNAGEIAVVIDDLATTGETKVESIKKLTAAGLAVRDVVVLIDRGQGAGPALAKAGYKLHAVTTLRQLLDAWHNAGAITADQFAEVQTFLDQST